MHDRAWGGLIARRRRELGLRQDEVAALADVSVRSVHAVEAGKATIRLDVLAAVAQALGLQLTVSSASSSASLVRAGSEPQPESVDVDG